MRTLFSIFLVIAFCTFAPLSQFAKTSEPQPSAGKSGQKVAEKVYRTGEVDQEAAVKNSDAVLSDFESKMRCRREGITTISAVLRKTGKVTDVKVTTTTGCKIPAKAIAALRKIKFTPARKNGRPVSQLYELDMKQELHLVPDLPDGTTP